MIGVNTLCFREKKQQQPKSIIYFITHSNGYETLLTLGYYFFLLSRYSHTFYLLLKFPTLHNPQPSLYLNISLRKQKLPNNNFSHLPNAKSTAELLSVPIFTQFQQKGSRSPPIKYQRPLPCLSSKSLPFWILKDFTIFSVTCPSLLYQSLFHWIIPSST